MKYSIKWLGHAAFQITTNDERVVLIDPWLSNPKGVIGINDLKRVDVVLITQEGCSKIMDLIQPKSKTAME